MRNIAVYFILPYLVNSIPQGAGYSYGGYGQPNVVFQASQSSSYGSQSNTGMYGQGAGYSYGGYGQPSVVVQPSQTSSYGSQPNPGTYGQDQSPTESIGTTSAQTIAKPSTQPVSSDDAEATLNFDANKAFTEGILYAAMKRGLQLYQYENWRRPLPTPEDEIKQNNGYVDQLVAKLGLTSDQRNKLAGEIWAESCKADGNIDAKGNCVWGTPTNTTSSSSRVLK